MTDWHDLVVTATVGTSSRPVDLAGTPEPVLAAAPPTADQAGSLLDAAVAFTLAHRAGTRPTRGAVPEPAPADPRPVVSPLAAELLRVVLVDRELDLAHLALAEVAAAGRRLPAALVPAALAFASGHRALRADTLRACGPLASWLAQQNPAWRWAVAGEAAQVRTFDAVTWETGDRAERLAQLRALRAAEPDAAAALLVESWSTTAPDERVDLLTVLGPVPRAADEPLLEATLDDRRAAVRQLTTVLLARLAGSAFRARAAERARGLVRVDRRGLRRVLVVADPAPFDPAARRDGLQEAPGPTHALGPAAGPVAERVRQLVAAAPLESWERQTGSPPDRLLGVAVERFGDELLAGWVEAALRERNARWVEALLDVARHRDPLQRRRGELVAVLPPERRTRVVVTALAESRVDDAAAVLAAAPRPWDPEVVAGFGRWWRRAAKAVPGRELLDVLPLAGRGLPATAEHAAALRTAAEQAPVGAIWLRAARAAAETIDLRRRLHEELR